MDTHKPDGDRLSADKRDRARPPNCSERRLQLERDEPSVHRALDLLCRDELLIAGGITRDLAPNEFSAVSGWQRWTSLSCTGRTWLRYRTRGMGPR